MGAASQGETVEAEPRYYGSAGPGPTPTSVARLHAGIASRLYKAVYTEYTAQLGIKCFKIGVLYRSFRRK